jgi:hypothetical protein
MAAHHRSAQQDSADFVEWSNAIVTPAYIYMSDWKLSRGLFQLDCMKILPSDLEALAACYRWTNRYIEVCTNKRQVAAAIRYAETAHEISCMRQFRNAIFASINRAYLNSKELTKLAAFNRSERLAKAAHKRAAITSQQRAAMSRRFFAKTNPNLRATKVKRPPTKTLGRGSGYLKPMKSRG